MPPVNSIADPAAAQGARRFPFRLRRRPEERIQLLGQTMDMVRPAEVLHFIAQKALAREKALVANHNAHSLYLSERNEQMAAFYRRADLVEADSLPLVAWARLTGRGRTFHRCTYLDWRDDFWEVAETAGFRVFFVGGAPGVAELAMKKIKRSWPRIQLRTHHGYFDVSPSSCESDALVAEITAFEPHILLVGMGMPRQELWLHQNFEALPACVMLPVGGAFDYEAGVQRPAPRWLGRIGLEWLFRLAADPRRMFGRYCLEPWFILHLLVEDALRTAAASLIGRRGNRRDSRRAAPKDAPRRRASDQRGSGPLPPRFASQSDKALNESIVSILARAGEPGVNGPNELGGRGSAKGERPADSADHGQGRVARA